MLRGSPKSEIDRHAYIPPEVQKSLNQHYSDNVPAHLKQYVSSNSSGYVSRGMEKAITSEMKRNLPAHLQQYADAYVQQSVVSPIISSDNHSGSFAAKPAAVPPMPDRLRRDHSMPFGEQYVVDPKTLPEAAKSLFEPEPTVHPSATTQPAVAPNPEPQNPYNFILSPNQAGQTKVKKPLLPGLPPMLSRVLAAAVGLILLIIIFAVVKGALSGGGNTKSMTAVVQDQTELLHLLSGTSNVQNISSANQTVIATMTIAIGSSNQQLISYLSSNGIKVSTKQADLKVSSLTDQSLITAQTAGDYDQVLDQALTSNLNTYKSDLSLAYDQTKGPKGRAQLKSDYAQANLLLTQLSSSTSS